MALSSFCPQCGAANPADDQLCMTCQLLLASETHQEQAISLQERYLLRGEIGIGGFGVVYQAWDSWEERLVAVKQIHLRGLSSQETIEATDGFNREIQLLTQLRHARLPRIYDHFSDSEHWYLVMSFIEGQSLDSYMSHRQAGGLTTSPGLTLGEVLAMGLQLCEVLSYLHEQEPPIIFRDLKPSNIMRTPDGDLVLIDFGIARQLKPGQEKDTMPFGSPGFAAPEQYGRAQTTPQADVYSLGALLFYLASGDDPAHHPFQFPPLPLAKQQETTTDGLNALIQRMVALEVSMRVVNMREVSDELQRLQRFQVEIAEQRIWTPPIGQVPPKSFPPLAPFSPAAQQQTPATQPRQLARRTILIGGSILAAGVLGGLGFKAVRHSLTVVTRLAEAPITQTPAAPTQIIQQSTSASNFSDFGDEAPISVSADLHYLAIYNSLSQVQIIDVTNRQLVQTIQVPDQNVIPQITWSWDDTRFVAVTDDGKGLVYDVKTGQNISTFQNRDIKLTSAVWSPDGRSLLGSTGPTVISWDPTNALSFDSRNQSSLEGEERYPGNLVCSPDGRYFACTDQQYLNGLPTPIHWQVEIGNYLSKTFVNSCSGTLVTDGVSYPENQCLAWSPKGDLLALSLGMAIWLIQPFQNNASTLLVAYDSTSQDAQRAGLLTWSPDGTRLAQIYQFSKTVKVWNIQSKRSHSATPTSTVQFFGAKVIGLAWSADNNVTHGISWPPW